MSGSGSGGSGGGDSGRGHQGRQHVARRQGGRVPARTQMVRQGGRDDRVRVIERVLLRQARISQRNSPNQRKKEWCTLTQAAVHPVGTPLATGTSRLRTRSFPKRRSLSQVLYRIRR